MSATGTGVGIGLVKKPKNADITLSVGPQGKLSGIILEVPKDPSLTHPFRQIDCINQIKEKIGNEITFNQYDFQAIIHKEKIRGNDKYHYCYKTFGANTYFQDLVDFIVKKIQANPKYFSEARAWFRQNLARKRKSKKK